MYVFAVQSNGWSSGNLSTLTIYPTPGEGAIYTPFLYQTDRKGCPTATKSICVKIERFRGDGNQPPFR